MKVRGGVCAEGGGIYAYQCINCRSKECIHCMYICTDALLIYANSVNRDVQVVGKGGGG